jgi:xanthine dehydrogenase accessory factor
VAQSIYEQLAAAAAAANRPFALALIAGTKGSSPQRAGAKAIFFPDGKIIGTLGGGCLEAEVQSRALKALKSGQPAEFEMVLDHDFGWDDGLICGGSVSGLILPHAASAADLWRKLALVAEPIRWGVKDDFSIAIAPFPGGTGDSPVPSGDPPDGTETTSHNYEGVLSPLSLSAVSTGRDGTETASHINEDVLDPISLSSVPVGGSPTGAGESPAPPWRYQETVSPPVELWIAGSGHVAQAIVPLAQQLDFSVTVFDDRPELANHQYFPTATKLRVGGWHELLQTQPPVVPAFGLVVTRGHQHDALVLSEWIRIPFAFLGMIGSRRKARIMRDQFIRQKIATPEQFDRIACPVGLDIAAVGTHEIAVSVLAQFIQKRAELRGK